MGPSATWSWSPTSWLWKMGENRSMTSRSGSSERPYAQAYTPVSEHLHTLLRPRFADTISDDVEFTETLDELEIYLRLIASDNAAAELAAARHPDGPWRGAFTWRGTGQSTINDFMTSSCSSRRTGHRFKPDSSDGQLTAPKLLSANSTSEL